MSSFLYPFSGSLARRTHLSATREGFLPFLLLAVYGIGVSCSDGSSDEKEVVRVDIEGPETVLVDDAAGFIHFALIVEALR